MYKAWQSRSSIIMYFKQNCNLLCVFSTRAKYAFLGIKWPLVGHFGLYPNCDHIQIVIISRLWKDIHHVQAVFYVHVKNDEILTICFWGIGSDGWANIAYFKIPFLWEPVGDDYQPSLNSSTPGFVLSAVHIFLYITLYYMCIVSL